MFKSFDEYYKVAEERIKERAKAKANYNKRVKNRKKLKNK